MGTTNCLDFNNPIAVANGGTAGSTATTGFNSLSPLTTKGDIIGYSGTHNVNLAVGVNGTCLIADSTASNGFKWAAVTGTVTSVGISSGTLTISGSPITTSGTLSVTMPLSIAGRNWLVNGDHSVAQKGAGGSASFAVAASTTINRVIDEWTIQTGANQACTISQIAGPIAGRFYGRVQRNSGQTGTGVIRYAQSLTISLSAGAANSTFTFSFKALCGADYSSSANALTVTLYTGTGTTSIYGMGGNFTGSATIISTTATLTTSEQSFAYTSSAAGSTVTQLCVEFSYTPSGTASTNDWFEVTDCQLENSPQATNFQRKSFIQNLKDCMHYYQKSFTYSVAPAQLLGVGNGEIYLASTFNSTTTQRGQSFTFCRIPNPISAAGATVFAVSGTSAQIYDLTNTTACTASAFGVNLGNNGNAFTCKGSLTTLFGDRLIVQYAINWQL